MVDVVDVDGWLLALLGPSRVVVAVHDPEAPRDDELTALLVAGRLDDAEHRLADTVTNLGSLARDGDPGLPVSSALAAWLFGSDRGLLEGDVNGLLRLLDAGDRGHGLAGAVLSAVALANAERLEDAVDVLATAEEAHEDLPRALLAVQRACRLGELGAREEAVDALQEQREILSARDGDRTLSDGLLRVVTADLVNLLPPGEGEKLWTELRTGTTGHDLDERTRLRARGLAESSDYTLTVLTAGAHPGGRWSAWQAGQLALLGAWLRAECWGDYGAIRTSRAEFAAHALTQQALPTPPNWAAQRVDRVDLDLARRSGDDRLTARAFHMAWDEGPVDELRHALTRTAGRAWPVDRELATLKALSASGDLLGTEAATEATERLVRIVDDGADRHFIPDYEVGPALAAILPAAPVGAHERVARRLTQLPVGYQFLQPFAVIPAALDVSHLPTDSCADLEAWARSALRTPSGDAPVLAVEILMALARRPDSGDTARDVLAASFATQPSVRVALGILLLTEDAEAPPPEIVRYLSRVVGDGPAREGDGSPKVADQGLDPPALLAFAATHELHATEQLTRFLARSDVDIPRKESLLAQLELGPQDVAQRVLQPDAVSALDDQYSTAPQTAFHDLRGFRSHWLGALAKAGRVAADHLLIEVGGLAGGLPKDRGHAADILGAAAGVLPPTQLVALLCVLLADREAQVASRAVSAVRRAFPDEIPEPVEHALATLTHSDGVARPLAAGHLLASRGRLDVRTAERLSRHPSALVRTAVRTSP